MKFKNPKNRERNQNILVVGACMVPISLVFGFVGWAMIFGLATVIALGVMTDVLDDIGDLFD